MKTASCEQMFKFIPKEIPHGKIMHLSLLPAVGMRDIINQFNLLHLTGIIARAYASASSDRSSIWQWSIRNVFDLLKSFFVNQNMKTWIECIEYQFSSVREMPMDCCKAFHLVFSPNEVLKWTVWNSDEVIFFSEIKIANIRVEYMRA